MRIAVIGGGASGIMSAVSAAEKGAEVLIIERMDRIGRKILATGNGRCNLTNMNASSENYYGANKEFVQDVLYRFSPNKTIGFFENIGLITKLEDRGKVYPYTDNASSVLDVLRLRLEVLGVKTKCGCEVKSVGKKGGEFEIELYSGEKEYADRVIVSCGGKASPSLGSNGSGYDILKRLGHRVTELYPSLVQAETKTDIVKGLKGLKKNCNVTLINDRKAVGKEFGEVLFTEYGLSGPPIFNLSAKLRSKGETVFRLDVMPEYDEDEIISLLFARRMLLEDYRLEDFAAGFLNKKIMYALFKQSKITPLSRAAETLTEKEIFDLAKNIKAWDFEFIKTRSWNNAQVTKGGVPVDEVDENMQSKKVGGLYITGEILNVDGECGGYNLQWAWSTGYIAGRAAIK